MAVDTRERARVFSEHAGRYSELGWALLRLKGKVPHERQWQKQTPDPAELAAGKWAVWGEQFNIGCLLGASGLAVFEADSEPALVRMLDLLGGVPDGVPVVETGRGLLHLYFQDGGHGNHARGGLELRAGAQQCVLPPSVHPDTGKPYLWLPGREPWTLTPGPAPAAVLDYFAAGQAKQPAPTVNGDIPAGGRHRTLVSLAGTMRRRGLGLKEIAAALRVVNEERCRPPLLDKELVDLVADIVRRYEPQQPDPAQVRLEREADRLFAAYTTGEQPLPPPPREEKARGKAAQPLIVRLVEYLGGDDEDADWLVDHLAARGALVIFAGLPKVGKSTFVYGMMGALTSSDETTFVGLNAGGRLGILLLTEEGPATVGEKADRFGLDDELVYVLPRRRIRSGRKWAKVVETAVEFCRDHPQIGLVVVDTLDKFADLDARRSEGDTGVIRETIDPLYDLLDLGVCVALITHQRKEEGSYGLRVRGGTALVGSADIVVEVERASDSAGLSKDARLVKLVSRFAGAPDEFAVALDEHGWRPLGNVPEARRKAHRDQVLAWLTGEPSTLDRILERADGTVPGRTLRRRLGELVKTGLAARSGRGTKGDPARWGLSQTWLEWLSYSCQGQKSGTNGPSNPSIHATDSCQPKGGCRGHGVWHESADAVTSVAPADNVSACPKHGGEHVVTNRAGGLVYLACGCHLVEAGLP